MKNSSHFNQSALAGNNRSNTSRKASVYIAWKGTIMLQFLCILSFSAGLRAQNFTYPANAEYGQIVVSTVPQLFQYKVANDAHYSSSDPRITLTMDCLAANGYGQWTVSSGTGAHVEPSSDQWLFSPDQGAVNTGGTWDPNSSSGWFLLSNLLTQPSEKFDGTSVSTHPGCQPPGVVSGGKFNNTYPTTTPKVAANLNGRVRYAWVEPTNRLTFKVEGLNDAVGATSAEKQIDISLANIPNPAVSRQIVKKPIFNYPAGADVTTADAGGTSHAIIGTEADHRDEFDIAMDKKYLYLVWNSSGTIYAKAILLSDGSVAQVAFPIGTGTRPTVACDVRSNPAHPYFAVAFIVGGKAAVGEYGNSPIAAQHGGLKTLKKTCNDPVTNPNTFNYTCNATHARVLCSSVDGTSHVTSIYAIECDEIILYKNIVWTSANGTDWDDIAWYVDGSRPYHGVGSDPLPSPIPQDVPISGVHHYNSIGGIIDAPIIAFANPYDNQSGTYNQFHCLYQVPIFNSGTATGSKPLILIRGADNGFGNNPNGNTSGTRLLLNQENISGTATVVDNPLLVSGVPSYCGAVNQMGIHVHWLANGTYTGSVNTHYYVRDTRTFDEPIEENTLATNMNFIADGSSSGFNHGGTAGAQLNDGVTMTLWSDPNYGAVIGSTTSGMYWQYPGGTSANGIFLSQSNMSNLLFYSSGLALTVGASGGSSSIPTLATMPVCNIAIGGNDGAITINDGATWDCYSTDTRTDWIQLYPAYDQLTVNLNGPTSGVASIPNLNIHAGSTFWECPSLNVTRGRIDILWGPNINSISSSTNASTSGLLRTGKTATISHSIVNSFLPYSSWVDELTDSHTNMTNVVMQIVGIADGGNSSIYNLHSSYTTYTNYANVGDVGGASGGGAAAILYDGTGTDDYGLDKVNFEHGTFDRMRIHALFLGLGGFQVINNNFDNLDLDVIHLEEANQFGYSGIDISSNTFLRILNHGTSGTHFDPDCGIIVENLNNSSYYGQLNINSNVFTSTVNDGNSNDHLNCAIKLINTTGNVESNTITDYAFGHSYGISITSPTLVTTYPYLCSNEISVYGLGIQSDHNQGTFKLCNEHEGDDRGYDAGLKDNPTFVDTRIYNNDPSTDAEMALEDNGSSYFAELNLTGVHTGGNNYAGYNTIGWDPGESRSPIEADIYLIDEYELVDLGNQTGGTSFGENNLEVDENTAAFKTLGSGDIGNINNNFWVAGEGVDPFSTSYLFISTTKSGSTFITPAETSWPGSISCSGGFFAPKGKGNSTLSLPLDSYDTCTQLKMWKYNKPFNQESAKEQRDSLMFYIEHCAVSDSTAWRAFTSLDGAIQYYNPDDKTRFDQYRAWLISVLYLNTTQPEYFCACMGSISGTYQYGKNYPLGGLAVMKWIKTNHPECWGANVDRAYTEDSAYDASKGFDPTHLPSLDSLDLGFLLHQNGAPSPTTLTNQFLASFTSVSNPFTTETTLDFKLNRMAYIQVAIYDVLGRLVWGDGRGSSLEAGEHTVHIEGKDLPSGTLYARISTGYGEVRTVKLVHEK